MSLSAAMIALLKGQGYSDAEIAAMEQQANAGSTTKTKKTGIYTRTQESSTVPSANTIIDNINKVYQQFYGRDATDTELQTEFPAARKMYTGPNGQSKSTIQETYKNGVLVDTQYLTADGQDPVLVLEDKIKSKLASGQGPVTALGAPEGPAGKYYTQIKNLAMNNGINLSDDAARTYADQIAAGTVDQNTVTNTLRESAASAFPKYADQIKAGLDLSTIADPYVQSMSKILELPSASIDLFNPTIRSALSYTMPDGSVGTKSLYDFETDLRKDPRWQYTQNAHQDVANSVQKVLQDFGFMG
jgi:hypothetical protein